MNTSMSSPLAPNHHAEHPGFSGLSGLIAGLSMVVGRGAVARLACDVVAVREQDRVVDVGCGPGTAARAAARQGARVTGVDPAAVMQNLARRLTLGDQPIEWVEGTAEALPLPDGSATVLWSIATVHHWSDISAGLAEAHRVLTPGGRILAIERRTRPGAKGLASHGWTEQHAAAFAESCRQAGFDDPHTELRRIGRRALLTVVAGR